MKKLILFSLLFLIGCSTPKLTTTTQISTVYDTITESYYNDTTIYITTSLSRQERKALKDSMNHVESLVKIENKQLKFTIKQFRKISSDSLDYENDKNQIELKYFEEITDAYKDSLKYEKRKHNKVVKENGKRSLWWVWMGLGAIVVIFLGFIKKIYLP